MTLEQVTKELASYSGKQLKIMEVCGTHTAAIFQSGIRSLISPDIRLISGPGCPVCVTAPSYIDKLIDYAGMEQHCVLTFGDMMKVKGNQYSLTESKAAGGNVRILYSPLDALPLAIENPGIQYVFAAVGFETTAPIYAVLLDEIRKLRIPNLKLLTSVKTIMPALSFLCETEPDIDAFLCPGHVSVITGSAAFEALAKRYKKPFVIAGFEGEHILAATDEIVHQYKIQKFSMKNLYKSAVSPLGNQKAMEMIKHYFERKDGYWREIGVIPDSALHLREEYREFDAGSDMEEDVGHSQNGCRCRDVILGRIHPSECPLFRTVCSPLNAIGPCMVSTEGTCGIWYKNWEDE